MLILKPSPIHGVGVFTTTPLKRGTRLPLSAETRDWVIVRTARGALARYCTRSRGGLIYAPKDPCRMSIGWYMNHSYKPNTSTEGDEWRTTRHVAAGQELTIDYHVHEAQL